MAREPGIIGAIANILHNAAVLAASHRSSVSASRPDRAVSSDVAAPTLPRRTTTYGASPPILRRLPNASRATSTTSIGSPARPCAQLWPSRAAGFVLTRAGRRGRSAHCAAAATPAVTLSSIVPSLLTSMGVSLDMGAGPPPPPTMITLTVYLPTTGTGPAHTSTRPPDTSHLAASTARMSDQATWAEACAGMRPGRASGAPRSSILKRVGGGGPRRATRSAAWWRSSPGEKQKLSLAYSPAVRVRLGSSRRTVQREARS
eukprot:scaffold54086_cov27-Tisochrysis_lutea.AAC.2